jgi:dipeptidyl-peptidase-3
LFKQKNVGLLFFFNKNHKNMNHKLLSFIFVSFLFIGFYACESKKSDEAKEQIPVDTFEYANERFADIQLLRYQVKGFDELTVKQKELAYYLYEAAKCGRDIIYDQKYKHNIRIRRTIEAIWENYTGDKNSEDFKALEVYLKRIWFSNGIHHHYASDKIIPEFSKTFFADAVRAIDKEKLPLDENQKVEDFLKFITPKIFDPKVDAKTVNLAEGIDNVVGSANNFYEGVTAKEVKSFYEALIDTNDKTPVEYGLNSKLIKENGNIVERVWKVGGMYSEAIEKIVYWLNKAVGVTETAEQKKALELLIRYYETGDLKIWDEYNIAWLADVNSTIDVVNGFIEVYQDAIGKRGSWESVVSMKDYEASKKIETIAKYAQWFEDNAPIMNAHKKEKVKGIIGKSITVIAEGGDATPSTPIGINLPNSDWVRAEHGSKSVALGNIVESYNSVSSKSPVAKEFALNEEILERGKKYGALAGELHTDMHEVIGHASGKLLDGTGTPDETLGKHKSTLEEARADLVALYYIVDNKLVEIGVMPTIEVGYAEYDSYMLNGLMLQLNRVEIGNDLEEAHMRNRQLVAKWAYEKGKADNVVEMIKRDGKTYVQINDYMKLRRIFGDLLREIQRIKSEGDTKAGEELVQNYGVKIDQDIHKEVKARFAKLEVAPYKGFIQPKLIAIEENGKIVDVKIEYPKSFSEQMMEYSKKYSFLKNLN